MMQTHFFQFCPFSRIPNSPTEQHNCTQQDIFQQSHAVA